MPQLTLTSDMTVFDDQITSGPTVMTYTVQNTSGGTLPVNSFFVAVKDLPSGIRDRDESRMYQSGPINMKPNELHTFVTTWKFNTGSYEVFPA